jgi:hypothetical protein
MGLMAQQCFNLFLLLRAKMLLSTAILAAHNKRGAVLGHVKSWAVSDRGMDLQQLVATVSTQTPCASVRCWLGRLRRLGYDGPSVKSWAAWGSTTSSKRN